MRARLQDVPLTTFDALAANDILFIDSTHEDFESTMEAVAKRIASDDPRFGILPKLR